MQKVQEIKILKGFSIAALHTHTKHSDGMVSPAELVRQAGEAQIKVLAITDHDTMTGIAEAEKTARKFDIEIVAGEEIQTSLPRGLHVLGLFLKHPIPHGHSVLWTIKEIRKQKGLAIIPHPFVSFFRTIPAPTAAFQKKDLISLVKQTKIDGIEIGHRFLSKTTKEKLESFYKNNQKLLGAQIGASDSHFGKDDLLSYFTIFPGKTAQDLYKAIKKRQTKEVAGEMGHLKPVHIAIQISKSLTILAFRRYIFRSLGKI